MIRGLRGLIQTVHVDYAIVSSMAKKLVMLIMFSRCYLFSEFGVLQALAGSVQTQLETSRRKVTASSPKKLHQKV